jgi:UDP-glucuronate decarboxylase
MYFKHQLYQEDLFGSAKLNLKWDKLKGKKILITGASGLIGCFLVDLLMYRNQFYNDKITIIAIGRDNTKARERFAQYWEEKEFSFFKFDICNPLPDIKGVDYIIHAASNTHPVVYASDPIGTITTNIIGTNNLFQYAVTHKIERLIFLSTVEIYGKNQGNIKKFTESDCGYIDCNTLRAGYPESKRAGEALCQAYINKYGLDIVIARLCRIYGPTMLSTDSKAVAQFLRNAIAGEDIILKSEGNQLFSYCYVADAVTGILAILFDGVKGEAYNIANNAYDKTLKEIVSIITEFSKSKIVYKPPNELERAGFSKATTAILDASKLNSIGWSAKYDLRNGLKRTIEILKT